MGGDGRPLAEVLGTLARGRFTGIVDLTRPGGGAFAVLIVREGKLQHLRTAQRRMPPPLALFKLGHIEGRVLREAVQQGGGPDTAATLAWLREKGGVSEERLREAFALEAREEVLDALGRDGTSAVLKPGNPRVRPTAAASEEPLEIDLEALVREGARRAAEMPRIRKYVPCDDDIPRPARTITDRVRERAKEIPELARKLAAKHVNGLATIGEIVSTAPAPPFEAQSALADAFRVGLLERLSPRKLAKVGHGCERAGDLKKALRLYLLAKERGHPGYDLTSQLARLCERLQDRPRALAFYVELAESLAALGRTDPAANALRRAAEQDGADPAPRCRLAKLLIEADRREEARDEVLALLDAEPALARAGGEVAAAFLARYPDDRDVRRAAEAARES